MDRSRRDNSQQLVRTRIIDMTLFITTGFALGWQKVNFLLYLRQTVDITEYRLLVVTYPAVYLNCIYTHAFFLRLSLAGSTDTGFVLLLHA